ncbi:leukocyte elastase inhibitor A-like [Pollicipes pollicipes]|uniref:leukocyte elastase inhibitor A-like n=1 Tax=Pollicipes pollicipes TaxID=41117 RepID=UPI00188573F7|nr:leukocyte elastase inhibitor A-like [Pollicipes pollicipes]
MAAGAVLVVIRSRRCGEPVGSRRRRPDDQRLTLAAAAAQLSRAHFDFTLSLYSALADDTASRQQDLLVSPYSVFSLLSMLFLGVGAESPSAAQLRDVLHFQNISYSHVQRAFQQAAQVMRHPYYEDRFLEEMALLLAHDVNVSDFYSRALDEFYRRTVVAVDFGKPERPVLLMMSKVHFHGQWMQPFNASMTFDKGLFFHEGSQRMEVPVMTGRFRLPIGYSHDLEARVLELPLQERRLSIFILLPDALEDGLHRLETNLTTDNLRAMLSTLKDETVHVKLPRFRLACSGHLRRVLMAQGLTHVFDPRTAAMTGINADGRYFEVDHPFVFLVWDYYSAMVLLMGRVVHPEPILD